MMRSLRRSASGTSLILFTVAVFIVFLITTRTTKAASTFTPGNLAVYRIGTGDIGASLVNTGNPIFIDEYTPAGLLVQSIALPTLPSGLNKPISASGTATSEGFLTRSADGQYLVLTGYQTPSSPTSLSNSTSVNVPRVVGRVDAFGNINTSTALTDFANTNNPRSAASTNGVDLWVAGAGGSSGGVRYATLGATTSTSLIATNTRSVEIFNNQLYMSSNNPSGVIATVGSGLPATSGQSITNLLNGGSPFAYVLADLDGVPGVDTLYVADDSAAAPGGITKYALVSGSWISKGTVGAPADAYRGLTGVVTGTTVTLYATRKGGSGATGGGELVSLVDSSGYNATLTGTPTLLATAAANTAFRGVASAPVPAPATVILSVSSTTASEASQTVVTVTANASTPVAGAQTVSLAVTGTGITSGDYVLSSSTITIPHGATSGSVSFTVVDDAVVEGPEIATLTISNPSAGITLGSPVSRNITIIDNDHPVPGTVGDSYTVEAGTTLTVGAAAGALSNDTGGPLTVFSYTSTAHGSLVMNPDGSFSYTPSKGFIGTDTFNYTANNAVPAYNLQVYPTKVPPLAVIGGVALTGGGYGSALTLVPGSIDEFYGLTDRGPNVTGPNGTLVEPLPAFTPSIGKLKLSGGQAQLEQVIPLQAADGTPYSGRVNSQADTGEVITDLNGNVLTKDPNGYDSEGIVALADGTFLVSDEYGPFITHFDANGKQIGRLSPLDGTLPRELANRVINRGMEGLTITPDGTMLVGMMQSALQQADLAGFDAKKLTPLRIVTYRFSDGALHEYLYLLDNPNTTKTAVSEITALTNNLFLVDERDGNFPPGAYKKLFRIDLTGATDIGPNATVPGAAYDNASGLIIGGKTIENLLRNGGNPFDTATSAATLNANGITTVSKSLYIDVGGLLDGVDPQGKFFSHDKLEGVVALNGGATITISNDSDFGVANVANNTPPFTLVPKITPAGVQDDGELLVVDLVRSTATVTLKVVDTIPPDTLLTSFPSNPTNSSAATFTFSGTDSGSGVAGFQCARDNGAFDSCSSGITYSPLPDGSHTFAVRAVDTAGNLDASPASYAWLQDTTAPVITHTEANPNVLWPPNKKMVKVDVTVNATDASDPSPICRITDITSNEGSSEDWKITGPLTVDLWADRDGGGDGRFYSIHVRCTDTLGNVSTAATIVTVPHDQGNN